MAQKRWQRRKEDRSGEILAAALACFSKSGFAATRMDDIARKARIAKGTIYLYFKNKEAVFKALARASVATRLDAVEADIARHQGCAADLLRLVIHNIGDFASNSDRIVLPKLLPRFLRLGAPAGGMSAFMICEGDSGGGVFAPDGTLVAVIAQRERLNGGRTCGPVAQAVRIAPQIGWIRSAMRRAAP